MTHLILVRVINEVVFSCKDCQTADTPSYLEQETCTLENNTFNVWCQSNKLYSKHQT